jgi:hypothetical protein
MTFEQFDSLSNDEKEQVLLKKIINVTTAHLVELYPEEKRAGEWFNLIVEITNLKGKHGLSVNDQDVDAVVFTADKAVLTWFNIGTFSYTY